MDQTALLESTLYRRDTTLVRRLRLAPGEATPWHTDSCHRVTVVVSGEALSIEFKDGGGPDQFFVTVGQTDWDEPTDRPHRAVNIGRTDYEEVTVFFLSVPGGEAQPLEPQ